MPTGVPTYVGTGIAVIHSSDHAQLHALVEAWRLRNDAEAAHHLRRVLQGEVVQLCWRLGVLYAQEQADQSIDAALYFTNPVASPRSWRRRSPGLREGEWEAGPATVFRGLCVHAILDSAGVATVDADRKALPLADRAAVRLRLADVVDIDDAARWLGMDPTVVDGLWCPPEVVIDVTTDAAEVGQPSRSGNTRRKVGAAAFATYLGTAGSAFAAMATAGAVAAAAVVIGVAGTGVLVQRGLLPADTAVPVESTSSVPGNISEVEVAPAGGGLQEGVEAPLAPGDVRPGLNVPSVDVPVVDLEDLLGEDAPVGDLLDELAPVPVPVPSLADLPTVPTVPTDLPAVPVAPSDLLPTEVETVLDGIVGEGNVGNLPGS